MTWIIAKKEIVQNLLSYKFFIVILLASLLIATSLFVMARDFKGRQADYQLIRPKPGEPIAVNPPNSLAIFGLWTKRSHSRPMGMGLCERKYSMPGKIQSE